MVRTISEAVALIETICTQPGNDRLIKQAREQARRSGVEQAVRERDTPALYDWLMEGFSLQGISDAIARLHQQTWQRDMGRRLWLA